MSCGVFRRPKLVLPVTESCPGRVEVGHNMEQNSYNHTDAAFKPSTDSKKSNASEKLPCALSNTAETRIRASIESVQVWLSESNNWRECVRPQPDDMQELEALMAKDGQRAASV